MDAFNLLWSYYFLSEENLVAHVWKRRDWRDEVVSVDNQRHNNEAGARCCKLSM